MQPLQLSDCQFIPAELSGAGDCVQFVDDAGFGPEVRTVPVLQKFGKVSLEYPPAYFMLRRLQPDEVARIQAEVERLSEFRTF